MKRYIYLSVAAVFLFCKASSQQLVSAEYFYDNDPGVGNGTALSVTTGDSVLFSGTISSTGLPAGFHFLYIRTKNTSGRWSIAERRMLNIRSGAAGAASLTAAEYFYDNDPGVGNGTSLTVTTGDSILFSGSVPTTALPDGFHFLYIRSKNSNGNWSISERRMFFIQSVPLPGLQLTAAEYYFDSDPGVGNGTAIAVLPGDTINFAGLVPTTSLGGGFHFLYLRAKSTDGKWSIAERRMFYVQDGLAVPPPLVAAEFFVDIDPGFGNATAISVIGGDSIDFNGPLLIADTALGFHNIYIRVKNSVNIWSLYETRLFEISGSVGVNEISSPDNPRLFQNFPNPFSNNTTVEFYLHKQGDVMLCITDFLGREVRQIKNENLGQGMHSVKIDQSTLEEGYYFYKLVFGDFADTKKMILLRQ